MDRGDEEVVSAVLGGDARWRRWLLPLRRAAIALWLAAALPFLLGPLTECDHCVGIYLASLPLVPGIGAAMLLRLDGVLFFAAAGAAMVALLVAATAGIARGGRHWPWVAIAAFVVSGAQAMGYAGALRM